MTHMPNIWDANLKTPFRVDCAANATCLAYCVVPAPDEQIQTEAELTTIHAHSGEVLRRLVLDTSRRYQPQDDQQGEP